MAWLSSTILTSKLRRCVDAKTYTIADPSMADFNDVVGRKQIPAVVGVVPRTATLKQVAGADVQLRREAVRVLATGRRVEVLIRIDVENRVEGPARRVRATDAV